MTIADGFHFYLGRLLFGLAYTGMLLCGFVAFFVLCWGYNAIRNLLRKRRKAK